LHIPEHIVVLVERLGQLVRLARQESGHLLNVAGIGDAVGALAVGIVVVQVLVLDQVQRYQFDVNLIEGDRLQNLKQRQMGVSDFSTDPISIVRQAYLQLLALTAQAQQIDVCSINGQHDRVEWEALDARMEPFGLLVHHVVDAHLALVVVVECDLRGTNL
jgi:hypothetical protein